MSRTGPGDETSGGGDVSGYDDGVHGLTPLYAVDALDPQEAAAAEAHLRGCAECREELVEVREAMAAAVAGEPAEPPSAALRARVMAALDDVPQLPALPAPLAPGAAVSAPAAAPVDELSRRRAQHAADDRPSAARSGGATGRRAPRRWLQGLAAAAAAVVVAGAAVTGYAALQWRDEARAAQQVAQAMTEVAGAPDAQVVDAQGGADGWGGSRVMVSRSLGEAVLVPTGVEDAPSGRTWQLWFVAGDAARPAGTFSDTGSAAVLSGAVDGAEAVAVTLEPAGGSESPTTTPVAVYPLTA